MSELQKLIKYFAIAFAIFLIFNIISGIMRGTIFLSKIFDDNDKTISEKLEGIDINQNVNVLDIDVSSVSIIIKKGEKFKAETNNKYINCEQDNNKLFITEEKHNWFNFKNDSDLIIYVPENFIFDGVSIENGAGKLNAEKINTKKLYLDLGAGKVEIDNLNVSDDTKINGGAGEIIISNGNMNDLDLDMGVGKLTLSSYLKGSNEIDAGVGEVDLTLFGKESDYKINIDKGIGSATINGEDIKDGKSYGNGKNELDIDGGVGSIKIKIENKKIKSIIMNYFKR